MYINEMIHVYKWNNSSALKQENLAHLLGFFRLCVIDFFWWIARIGCSCESSISVLCFCIWCDWFMWDMTHSYVWHDSFMCDMTHSYVTWLMYDLIKWDMTHVWCIYARAQHSSVMRLIHMCDMTHSYVWHDSFICVTWLIHMCDMTHSYVW